jgi:peptidoglycan/LPS O-acetylase OafA/YrhL
VLSGFLITSILCEAAGTRGYFTNFYMRRLLRIFPLYFGALVVAFGVVPLLFGWQPRYADVYRHQWALWLYAQNFVSIDWRAFSHFWSLAVEEHFYLVWPAVLFFCGRRGSIAACGAMIVAAWPSGCTASRTCRPTRPPRSSGRTRRTSGRSAGWTRWRSGRCWRWPSTAWRPT